MKVRVKLIQRSRKQHGLADAIVELSDTEGDSIIITDLCVLKNKQGQVWVAMPNRSVSEGGRPYKYISLFESNKQLRRKITDSVLSDFEKWRPSCAENAVRL